jgi:hypothetical protein
MHVTSFVDDAHIACKSYKTGCQADVNRVSGDNATACLPSRLSRVRAPSPALTSSISPSKSSSQAVSLASSISRRINNVIILEHSIYNMIERHFYLALTKKSLMVILGGANEQTQKVYSS